MKMTFTKSQYEMPDGKYLARFMGVTLRDATGQTGQDGKPLPPGMTWDFEIAEGESAGKKADKLTGRMPTPKSACGKFLAAIADTVLKDGVEVDIDNYRGKFYRITVIDNRVSDSPPPVRVYQDAAPAGPQPPRPPAPPQVAAVDPPAADTKWDVYGLSGKWEEMDARGVQKWIVDNSFHAEQVFVKPAGADQGAMQPAARFGFSSDPVPF